MELAHDSHFLDLALDAARARKGFTSPNPAVGAVLTRRGLVISTGSHQGPGTPHAEVIAIGDRSKLSDHTLYVSLEPCNHHGRTPPCTELILARGVERVVYGFSDPNLKVTGHGGNRLSQAGVLCTALAHDSTSQFYAGYRHWCETGLPYVTAKLALSLDDKIALEGGKPTSVTGEEFKRFTHESRKSTDAILTTATTVLADDPMLNARVGNDVFAKPVYVLDSKRRLSPTLRLFHTGAPVTIFTADTASPFDPPSEGFGPHVRALALPQEATQLSLRRALLTIAEDGRHEVWVEAGKKLFAGLRAAGLMQKGILAFAPKLLGSQAYPLDSAPSRNLLLGAHSLVWHKFGEDAVLVAAF